MNERALAAQTIVENRARNAERVIREAIQEIRLSLPVAHTGPVGSSQDANNAVHSMAHTMRQSADELESLFERSWRESREKAA